jgi:ERCC4-type nuclease
VGAVSGGEASGLLIAPTEPRQLKRLGESSIVPEMYGVDVLWGTSAGLCGVQRKEFKDLLASMEDGRLGKEVAQMQGKLHVGVVVVEGDGVWGTDGQLMDAWKRVSRHQVRSYLYTVRSSGVWVEVSEDLADTIQVVEGLVKWTRKMRHTSLLSRPGPGQRADWGKANRHEWAVHLLSGFEGVGVGVAENILAHFGKVPLRWEVSEEELRQVKGVGKVRARKLIEALEQMEVDGERVA